MLKKTPSQDSNSNPSFIGIYDNVLSAEECDELISFFHSSDKRMGGFQSKQGYVVDYEIKKNVEINNAFLSKTPEIAPKTICNCIRKYKKEYSSLDHIFKWQLQNDYTFQMLEGKDDGYKQWHTEHCPGELSKRILAWMIYLNDAESGTEFMHFPTVEAKQGRCIIWPSAFTHLHRSVPNKSLKYIMSGWFSFL